MSQEERTGIRDRTYSAWHRRGSLRRFVGLEQAQLLAMADIDAALWVEYDDLSKVPLAIIETARDTGDGYKSGTVLHHLAKRARLPGYVVLLRPAAKPNPADTRCQDVASFRVRRVWPRPENGWRELTPAEWANGLLRIRTWSATRLVDAENDPLWDV